MTIDNLTPEEEALVQAHRQSGESPRGPGYPVPYDESAREWGVAPPANPPTVTRLVGPQEWVGKQLRNIQAVGEVNYREGITRPKKDPIQAGIAAQGAYEAKMRDPAVLKRREHKLRQTNMEEWASMAERVGASRLVQGVVERQFKIERAVGNLHPKLAAHLQRIDAMPNVTDADRERRMVENLKGLKALKGQV
ncbi:MAG: hypothetical protein ACREEO_14365 [Phenylobacterium sp.]